MIHFIILMIHSDFINSLSKVIHLTNSKSAEFFSGYLYDTYYKGFWTYLEQSEH